MRGDQVDIRPARPVDARMVRDQCDAFPAQRRGNVGEEGLDPRKDRRSLRVMASRTREAATRVLSTRQCTLVSAMKKQVVVNDKMQSGYAYCAPNRSAGTSALPSPPAHASADAHARVFGGKYMTDCRDEFPAICSRRETLPEASTRV